MDQNLITIEDSSSSQPIQKQMLNIEEASELVGDSGIYQKRTLVYLWVMFSFLSYYFFLVPSTTYPPQFICADGSICTETSGGCDVGGVVDSDLTASAVAEFGLYCDKAYLRNLLQSIGMVGAGVGLFIVNQISDNFSRKKSIIAVWIIGSISAIGYALSPSTALLIITQFGIGFGMNSLLVLFLVQINELSNKYKVMGITIGYGMSSFGQILIFFIIMITENWRYQILFFFGIPSAVLCSLAFFLIDDQPRFLVLKDKKQCVAILHKIAKVNKNYEKSNLFPLSEEQITTPKMENLDDTNAIIPNRKYTYFDLFKFASQRRVTIPLTLTLFFLSALYYGTQLSLDDVGFSFQRNCLYVGISELCGYFASDRVCGRLKRRLWGAITMLITSLFLILDAIFAIPSECLDGDCYQKPLQMVFTCLARFVVSFSFSFLLIQIGEAFPNSLKSIGYGFVTGISTIGSVLSPYLQSLAISMSINPLYVLGVIGMLSCACVIFSKETFNEPQISDIPELLQRDQSQEREESNDIVKGIVSEVAKNSDVSAFSS